MASVVDLSDKPVALQGIPLPGYSAVDLRRLASTWLPQEGVVGAGDFKAVPGAAAKTISVPGGQAAVEGDSTAEQSRYYCRHTGAAIVLDLATPPDATNPRIDQVVLEVKDDAHDASGLNTGRLRVISGTPTPGATLVNRSGAAALPASCARVLDLLVPANFNAVFVAGTHFIDRRAWARGLSRRVVRLTNAGGTNDYFGPASFTAIDAVNLDRRCEFSGVPVKLSMRSNIVGTAADAEYVFRWFVDGGYINGNNNNQRFRVNVNAGEESICPEADFTPTPGSRVVSSQHLGSAITIRANAGMALELVIAEDVRQNADNT